MAIDHIMINCSNYPAAIKFYGWLLPQIGYPQSMSFDQPAAMTGWYGDEGSVWVCQPAQDKAQAFSKERVGIREIAFRAESRAHIDQLAKAIGSNGGAILDQPREYDYVPGYYAVFFTDPDGIKLELVHTPQGQG